MPFIIPTVRNSLSRISNSRPIEAILAIAGDDITANR